MQPVPRGVHVAGRCTFDLRYQPHALNPGDDEREIEEDDLSTAFYEDEEIDLGQLMREQFYLSLPMKPLCRTIAGAVPDLRDESEPRHMRVQARLGRSEARGTEKLKHESKAAPGANWMRGAWKTDAESKTTTFQDADGQAPHARRLSRSGSASARTATSRSRRTACAPTAGTTADARRGAVTQGSDQRSRTCPNSTR